MPANTVFVSIQTLDGGFGKTFLNPPVVPGVGDTIELSGLGDTETGAPYVLRVHARQLADRNLDGHAPDGVLIQACFLNTWTSELRLEGVKYPPDSFEIPPAARAALLKTGWKKF